MPAKKKKTSAKTGTSKAVKKTALKQPANQIPTAVVKAPRGKAITVSNPSNTPPTSAA